MLYILSSKFLRFSFKILILLGCCRVLLFFIQVLHKLQGRVRHTSIELAKELSTSWKMNQSAKFTGLSVR